MAGEMQIVDVDDESPSANARLSPGTEAVGTMSAGPAAEFAATATDTPRKLFALPELADRYVPIYSTLADVVYRDPSKFSLKPPYWEKWSATEYGQLAQYLSRVDLVPIARELNKPVEEVYHMYHAAVVNPLHHAKSAKKRGVQGMKGWFKLYNDHGTPTRAWGVEQEQGELENITHKTVHLILWKTGFKCKLSLDQLDQDDHRWIQENVHLQHRRVLSGLAAGETVKYKTEDGLPPYTQAAKRALSPEPFTPSKQARLVESATAPAKMRATPSTFDPAPPQTLSRNSQASPTSSKQAGPIALTTPIATSRFSCRGWTAARVEAYFYDTAPGAVVVVEKVNSRQIIVPKEALIQLDKEWLNERRKESLIDDDGWTRLLRGVATTHPVRAWTAENLAARYLFVSHLTLHLLTEPDGALIARSTKDLTDRDKDWLRKNVDREDLRTLSDFAARRLAKAAAKMSSTQGSRVDQGHVMIDSNSDQEGGDEMEAPEITGTPQTPSKPPVNRSLELVDRGMSVAVPDPVLRNTEEQMIDADSIPLDTNITEGPAPEAQPGVDDSAVDEPYEGISDAPIRQWTEYNLVASLVGIAKRKVFLRVPGKDGVAEQLPRERWSEADLSWLREYLNSAQQKILSGKV